MVDMVNEEEPTGVRVSASQLDAYEKCSLKWKFMYIDKIRPEATAAMVTGTFVHSVFEMLYERPGEERTEENAKLIAREEWNKLVETEDFQAFDLTEPEQKEFRVNSWRLIKRLWEIERPENVEVHANEMKFEYDLEEGLSFIGFADRLDVGRNGSIEIVDYKSGKRPAMKFAGDKKRQIRLYALAVNKILGLPVSRGKLLFFGGGSPGIITVKITDDIINETEVELLADARKVKKAKLGDLSDIQATPHTLCGWCDFATMCPVGETYLRNRVESNDFRRLDAPALKELGIT